MSKIINTVQLVILPDKQYVRVKKLKSKDIPVVYNWTGFWNGPGGIDKWAKSFETMEIQEIDKIRSSVFESNVASTSASEIIQSGIYGKATHVEIKTPEHHEIYKDKKNLMYLILIIIIFMIFKRK